jgi:hypothetical protein
MGELGEALILMHGARDRFKTVRALIRERVDGHLAARAVERFAASPEGRAAGFDEDFADRADDRDPRVREGLLRLWLEMPDLVREETEGDFWGGSGISIRDGRRWWSHHPGEGVHSNEDDLTVGADIGERAEPLLDPAPLLGALRFEPRGEVEIAGREALALTATSRPGVDLDFTLGQLPLGAEAYDLAVDRERGILLRAASLVDGAEFALVEMLEVAFDEHFPADTFVLSVPEGTRRRPTWGAVPREMTIDEVADLASFAVWFPKRISSEWRVSVGYLADDPSSGETERVLIRLWREDATHQVSIVESAPEPQDIDEEWADWTTVDREGVRFEAAEAEHGPTRIRFEREDTSIRLMSDLDPEALFDLARDLERV